jgi:NADH-quinone oxidoreductase subunit G
VLGGIADEMDVHLGLPDPAAALRELEELGTAPAGGAAESEGAAPSQPVPRATVGLPAGAGGKGAPGGEAPRSGGPGVIPRAGTSPRATTALLATWHNLLDAGRMQDGEPNLAGTARAAVAKISAATAAEIGVADGSKVTVATDRGAVTVPAEIAEMPDRVVWLPANSAGCAVRDTLGAGYGSTVSVRSAG